MKENKENWEKELINGFNEGEFWESDYMGARLKGNNLIDFIRQLLQEQEKRWQKGKIARINSEVAREGYDEFIKPILDKQKQELIKKIGGIKMGKGNNKLGFEIAYNQAIDDIIKLLKENGKE